MGHVRRPRVRGRRCSETSTASTSSSSGAAPATSRRGSPGGAPGRSASTSRPRSSTPHAGCRRRRGSSFRSSRRAPRTCRSPDASFDLAFSEYGASIWCDPYLWIPEAYRLLRPGGRLVFLRNSPLVMLCALEDARRDVRDAAASAARHAQDRVVGRRRRVPPRARRHVPRAPRHRVRGRGTRRALRSGGREDARVLRLRHRRLGDGSGRSRRYGRRASPPDPRVDVAAAPRDPRAARDPVRRRRARTTSRTTRPTPIPTELVRRHAVGKARSVHTDGNVTLGVDTTVVLDGRIYGKASSADDAARMLRELSGRTHTVVSGLCLLGAGDEVRRP